ncbi:MAG TPA: hypothetical protein VE153_28520 [Myxococcus sp.]|nr:hypothetical protein [Myxococcus sp.]
MKALLKQLTPSAVLATTAVLLSAGCTGKCLHEAQDVAFDVSGNTCGSAGTLRLSTAQDSCELRAVPSSGTGLPEFGDVGSGTRDLKEGGWYLHDASRTYYVGADGGVVVPDAGSGTEVSGNRHCEATREGDLLRLRCVDRRSDLSGVEVGGCAAVLTPRLE